MSYEIPSDEKDTRALRKEISQTRSQIRFSPTFSTQVDSSAVGAGSHDYANGVVTGNFVLNPEDHIVSIQLSWTGASGTLSIGDIVSTTATSTGGVGSVAIVSGGTGYTDAETLTLTGGTSGATNATGTATVSSGVIISVTIVSIGSGYTNGETLTLTGGTSGATNATGTATTNWQGMFLHLVTGDSGDGTGVFEPQNIITFTDVSQTLSLDTTWTGATYTTGTSKDGAIVTQAATIVVDTIDSTNPVINTIFGAKNDGHYTTIKPKSGLSLSIDSGGNFDISSTTVIADSEFNIIQFFESNTNADNDGSWILLGGTEAKTQDLGDLDGSFEVDFDIFSNRLLFGNQVGQDVSLTFINIPLNLSTNIKIYMTPANASGSLTIGGNDIFSSTTDPFSIKTLVTNDFLSIEIESSDQSTINITSVKKNDDVDTIPGIPGNIYAIGNTSSSVIVSWDQPEEGTLPITYNIAWSTTSAGDSTNGPTTPETGSPLSGITENLETVTGLTAAITYFFWVQGVNSAGSGEWAGPQQTNTEGTTIAGAVNFSIPSSTILYNSITITWDQTAALLFTLFRTDPDGTITTLQERSIDDTDIVDTSNILDSTNYDYTLQTYNEFGLLLGIQTISLTSGDLPVPVLTIDSSGLPINLSVNIVSGINICRIEWDTVNTFTGAQRLYLVKTVARSIAETVADSTPDLSMNTEYFVRARFELNGSNGEYNETQSITTGTLPTPGQPTLTGFTSSPVSVIRFKINFADTSSVNETAKLSVRDNASVQEYFEFPGNSLSRDSPPSDDLDSSDEDEIEVVRAGGGWGATGVITVVSGAVTSIDITNGGSSYTNGSTVRIYDDNDLGGGDGSFKGTAIVSNEQLTGVTIVSGGDFYDNGNTVLLPAQSVSGDSVFSIWTAGNTLTLRGVASNLSGDSDADTENAIIGS